ncbi:hypothetical protein CJJ09_005383 [Candidozyma auris]|nr:hypothetical protein CJJ09_005383 [[Candida] auris]
MSSVIAASVPVGLSSGAMFAYSIYGPQLAHQCHLDSSQAANLNIAVTVGSALGGLGGGYITDTFGSLFPMLGGWLLVAGGYFWVHQLYLLGEEAASWMLILSMFLVGAGSTASYFAAIKAVTLTSSRYKGSAQSIPIASFAIASLLYSFVFTHILHGEVGPFLLFLSGSAFFMQLAGVIFIRVPGHEEKIITFEYAELLNEAEGPVGEPARMPPEQHTSGWYHHLELAECLTHRVFWAHFALIAIFQGLGQMYIYTVGYILKAVHYYFTHATVETTSDLPSLDSLQAIHVSLIAIGSFTGRLSSGPFGDFLVNKHGWTRHSVLVLALLLMGAGHSALIYPIDRHSSSLWSCNVKLAFISAIIGYAYGFGFTTLPAIISDLFSMKNYSFLWGIMYSSTVPGLPFSPSSLAPTIKKRTGEEAEAYSQPEEKKQKKTPKYKFDWDEEDDTSNGYEPLVTLEETRPVVNSIPEKHWSQKPLQEMTARDWRIFKDDYNISSKGDNIGNPLRFWHEDPLIPKKVLDIIQNKLRYQEPTPIQRASLPLVLRNRDVVGVAETGSGKTLAFVIPLLSYILGIEPEYMKHEHTQEANTNRALGLILAPTRELALQIAKETQKFTDELGLSVVTVIGGHKYEETIHSLRNGVHIVVATPGRLVDSLERGIINLSKCYNVTMDEADKMIDMGFEKSLNQILNYLPTSEQLSSSIDSRILRIQKRNTVMFTATITPTIERLTKNYLQDPAYLFVGSANELVDTIDQNFEYMGPAPGDKQEVDANRLTRLVQVLERHKRSPNFSVIIFANFKRVVESLAEDLAEKSFKSVVTIHGSKSQEAREVAIEKFRSRSASILIATDVAARGIDIPHVSLVVNFQMSNKFEEYIHRIGRTGRAGEHGESYTFVDDGDRDTFIDLKKFLSRGGKKVPDWLREATRFSAAI